MVGAPPFPAPVIVDSPDHPQIGHEERVKKEKGEEDSPDIFDRVQHIHGRCG
jgi:hypothetical protein